MEKKSNQRMRIYLQQTLNREHITVDDWKDYLEAYKTYRRTTHAFFEELMECGASTNCDCEVKQKWITKVVDWYHEENDGETGKTGTDSQSADGDTSEDGGVEPCVEEAKQTLFACCCRLFSTFTSFKFSSGMGIPFRSVCII